jgi:hypothetical protein
MTGAGMALYGFAVGCIYCHVSYVAEGRGLPPITIADPNLWTRGSRKEHRRTWIAQGYPQYDPEKDKGGDVSDAICLGEWWYGQRELQGVDPGPGRGRDRATRSGNPRRGARAPHGAGERGRRWRLTL